MMTRYEKIIAKAENIAKEQPTLHRDAFLVGWHRADINRLIKEISTMKANESAFLLEIMEVLDQHPDDMNDTEMVEEIRTLIYRKWGDK